MTSENEEPDGGAPLKQKMAQVERNRRIAWAIGAVLAVAVVATAVIMIVTAKRSASGPPVDQSQPAGALDTGGILLGQDLVPGGEAPAAQDAVTVEVISDFLCPWCGTLEEAQGEALAALAKSGEIRLVIHPVAALSDLNGNYSWRSLTAAETVAALEPDKFWAFYEALWAGQPEESTDAAVVDLTDEEIVAVALGAGVSQATADRFADPPGADGSRGSSDEGRGESVGTPTVLMSFAGSEPVTWQGWLLVGQDADGNDAYQPGDLAAAVALVKAGEDPNTE
ncbi:MAG: thioredoxin domain-containing protein [Bifidobacteriaceae bacterium]|jgi:protein-disulfide isomerase|nr:thioredoxin domain-containing protein [Bifidobacteriaceae bacterium]